MHNLSNVDQLGSAAYLRSWQSKRLTELSGRKFSRSEYYGQVTLLIYVFPIAGHEEEAFKWASCSILHTWSVVGTLKTVIVVDREFSAARTFAAEHDDVELQVEPSLVPRKIDTLSQDCIKRLYTRFDSPYVLIIQDDGFAVRDNLGDFIGKADCWGAPIVSEGWKRKLLYGAGLVVQNGGFSLRSRSYCRYAAWAWRWFFRFVFFYSGGKWSLGEDAYYTFFLRFLPTTWFRFRFPSEAQAFCFAYDELSGCVKLPAGIEPFGVHGKYTLAVLHKAEGR